ncbi:MAG: GIY-YIG nuclease family protein [Candidatus Omnitrophica bacterium]|nr:GIY-YIG nuclease family protein [Candidatus Omnitrophota bacterium]
MFFVYLLLSKVDKKFYIGFTENIAERLLAHNSGKVISTKHRKPLELIYYEAYLDIKDAQGREKFLKSGSGHRFLKKQLSNFLSGRFTSINAENTRGGAAR